MSLISEAKNYLDITYSDEAADSKLSGILARGKAYLDGKIGCALNYERDDAAKALLFDYARYVRANSLETFEPNFRHEILDLQMTSRKE